MFFQLGDFPRIFGRGAEADCAHVFLIEARADFLHIRVAHGIRKLAAQTTLNRRPCHNRNRDDAEVLRVA